ncbi:MAG: hypothetical protein JNN11_02175 [Candidatus Doudnabacteria bacterium]|nr:hypothetical protein [Candidatus Doudnabacteria bacterium]
MNKKIGIGLAVIVITIAAYMVFNVKDKASESSVKSQDQTQIQSEIKTESEKKSLKSLAMAGKPQKCTFTQQVENSESSGTYFISTGKVRGDYNVKTQGQNISGHMILDGSIIYTWSDAQTQGFKMEVLEENNSTSQTNQNINVAQQLAYKCEDWKLDEAVFSLPKDVTFKTMAEASGGANTMSQDDIKAMQCKACDNVPAESGMQCKQALNCK